MAWVEFQEGPFTFLRKKNLRPMFYALTWNSRFQSVFMSVDAILFGSRLEDTPTFMATLVHLCRSFHCGFEPNPNPPSFRTRGKFG